MTKRERDYKGLRNVKDIKDWFKENENGAGKVKLGISKRKLKCGSELWEHEHWKVNIMRMNRQSSENEIM